MASEKPHFSKGLTYATDNFDKYPVRVVRPAPSSLTRSSTKTTVNLRLKVLTFKAGKRDLGAYNMYSLILARPGWWTVIEVPCLTISNTSTKTDVTSPVIRSVLSDCGLDQQRNFWAARTGKRA